jgi:hypothetical protein
MTLPWSAAVPGPSGVAEPPVNRTQAAKPASGCADLTEARAGFPYCSAVSLSQNVVDEDFYV